MRLLDKYIAKHVMMGVALVSLVIIGIDVLFSFLAELDELKGDYKTIDALRFVIYSAPRHFYDYMPFAVMIGCLLGLGVLADHRELTVMRAAGVSLMRISSAAFLPVLLFLLINVVLAQYGAPQLQQTVEIQKDILRSREDVISSQRGFWHRDGNQFIHFNAADPAGTLYGITVYEFLPQQVLNKVFFAKTAEFAPIQNHWRLHAVETVILTASATSLEKTDTQVWETNLSPAMLKTLVIKPRYQSISDLYHFGDYLHEQGLSADQYRLAFWGKLFQPLAILSLTLIALSFVFGSLRSITMGFRIFCGVVVGLIFNYSQDMLEAVSLVYGLSPAAAVLLPIAACGVVGVYLLKRAA